MSEAYLIYVPILAYEESINPLMIVHTKADAERIVTELQEWCKSQAAVIGEPPDMDDDDEVWEAFWKREERVTQSTPPYGLSDLISEVKQWRDDLEIESMDLPAA